MSLFFGMLAIVLGGFAYLGFVIWLGMSAIEEGRIWRGVVALLLIACPFALLLAAASSSPDAQARVLCLHGHQEWVRTGKTTRKAWICDTWEAEAIR